MDKMSDLIENSFPTQYRYIFLYPLCITLFSDKWSTYLKISKKRIDRVKQTIEIPHPM